MQKWYNNLAKGQRIIIDIVIVVIFWIIGGFLAANSAKILIIICPILGILLCIFLEIGRKKQSNK